MVDRHSSLPQELLGDCDSDICNGYKEIEEDYLGGNDEESDDDQEGDEDDDDDDCELELPAAKRQRI